MSSVLELTQEELKDSEIKSLIKMNGTLKRQRIPNWVKKAVYFRDRGQCVLCGKDLSNR